MKYKSISPLNAYNRIAWLYEPLSRWCLGNKYIQSKRVYLERLKRGDTVLNLGGGTGDNVTEIMQRIGPEGKLYFMDASSSMIRRTKGRFEGQPPSTIQFIHSADFSVLKSLRPDVILTHYFLDVLTDEQLEVLFGQVGRIAKPDSEWIFTDFFPVPHKRWLTGIMIGIFRVVVHHLRKELPDYSLFFHRWGWKEKDSCSFLEGFIRVKVYGKG